MNHSPKHFSTSIVSAVTNGCFFCGTFLLGLFSFSIAVVTGVVNIGSIFLSGFSIISPTMFNGFVLGLTIFLVGFSSSILDVLLLTFSSACEGGFVFFYLFRICINI